MEAPRIPNSRQTYEVGWPLDRLSHQVQFVLPLQSPPMLRRAVCPFMHTGYHACLKTAIYEFDISTCSNLFPYLSPLQNRLLNATRRHTIADTEEMRDAIFERQIQFLRWTFIRSQYNSISRQHSFAFRKTVNDDDLPWLDANDGRVWRHHNVMLEHSLLPQYKIMGGHKITSN